MAEGKHARQIVVDSSCKDAAQHDPQIGGCAELRAHDGAEDRPQSRYVEKLYHEDFPGRKRNVVHPVGFGQSGCLAVVWAEDPFNETPV